MAGIRVGGTAILPPACSPPFSDKEGTDGDGDFGVWRACVGDTAGLATLYTDFNDGGTTVDGIHNPVLSPDGTLILFEAANASTGFTEIWVVNNVPNSTATSLLTDASNYYLNPSWHPDSDQFVCIHGAGGAISGGDVVSSAVSTPGTTAVLKSAGGGKSPFRPQYNFDGSLIAYIFDTNIGGTGELRVMADDGSGDASVDNAVKYRFQGGQLSWANGMNVIAYDDGASGSNLAYVINSDGTGQVQINANGVATGAATRVSSFAWPADDSFVVISANLFGGEFRPINAALDGSTTTSLNVNGANPIAYYSQVIVYAARIWWIKDDFVLGSCAIDGSDYRVDLTIDGAAMDAFTGSTGDGWYYN